MNKKKRKIAALLTLSVFLLGACSGQSAGEEPLSSSPARTAEPASQPSSSQPIVSPPDSTDGSHSVTVTPSSLNPSDSRPRLIQTILKDDAVDVTPSVEPYQADPDLGNIDNLWQFSIDEEEARMLAENGFTVSTAYQSEYYQIYENNRYLAIPNFVTVDSLMHTYHLYFGHLLKNIERDHLAGAVTDLSRQMLDKSLSQYDLLKGTEWENAAMRNAAFFTVGLNLLDEDAGIQDSLESVVRQELDSIQSAEGIRISQITGTKEDYSQYIPRGYYEGEALLESYFKAMIWYGRIHFSQEDADLDRSALLMTLALAQDPEMLRLWESVYAVTSFFAGASDDLGVCEYAPLLQEAYGGFPSLQDLTGNPEAFEMFRSLASALPTPRINSVPVYEDEDNVIPGFRFMGQRFTVDAAVMQQLVYRNVGANSAGENRMLPDVLDVPAALGSDAALNILEKNGAADYEGYSENMIRLRDFLSEENETLWASSLYAGWLHTLRPLLTPKGEGYPMFMQNEEWVKKDLECFSGSFTELKHDTVLYSKQSMAEMGGGYDREPDDRGYVEPEPLVYARFSHLASQTAQGLRSYGMLSRTDEDNLSLLAQIADRLLTISVKELQNEDLSEDEYEFIRCYGGNLEHFWMEAAKEQVSSEWISALEYPAAIITDIATDPNGQVLEAATGNPSSIYVVVNVDGRLKLAHGAVYTFYQFPWPMNDRLTDTKWRQMMGWQPDENGDYSSERPVGQPDWVNSYRYRYAWE